MKKPWFIKRWLLQGLVLTLPVIVTIVVFYYLIIYTDAILWVLWDLLPWDLLPWDLAKPKFPGLGLLVVTSLVIFIGAITESFVIGRVVELFNKLMSKLPFIRNIYTTVLKVAQSTLGNYEAFSSVVMIEYPRKGIYSLAFKTSKNEQFSEDTNKEYINVFLPTTPNPTSGFYLIVPKDEAIETDINPEEAFKLIISAGIVSK
jgi:uncharacterized membrane protein